MPEKQALTKGVKSMKGCVGIEPWFQLPKQNFYYYRCFFVYLSFWRVGREREKVREIAGVRLQASWETGEERERELKGGEREGCRERSEFCIDDPFVL